MSCVCDFLRLGLAALVMEAEGARLVTEAEGARLMIPEPAAVVVFATALVVDFQQEHQHEQVSQPPRWQQP